MRPLLGRQLPPRVLLLQRVVADDILIRGVENVRADTTARHRHRYVDVDLQFLIDLGIRLEFELQPAVEEVARLGYYQIRDDADREDGN